LGFAGYVHAQPLSGIAVDAAKDDRAISA